MACAISAVGYLVLIIRARFTEASGTTLPDVLLRTQPESIRPIQTRGPSCLKEPLKEPIALQPRWRSLPRLPRPVFICRWCPGLRGEGPVFEDSDSLDTKGFAWVLNEFGEIDASVYYDE